jgi:Flp pilus assembly protein TadG
MFVITLIPTLGMVGAAVDYSRATTARQVLNSAVDSAALMAARDAAKLTDEQLRTRINDWIRANLHGEEANSFGNATVTIDRTARTVNIAANLNVQTSLIRLVGQDTVAISSSSQSSWGTNMIEIALALDNTGSMASSGKMTALKEASLELIKIMQDATTETGQIKISIVPFAVQVRLDTALKNEPWLRFTQSRQTNCRNVWNWQTWRNDWVCDTETISKTNWTGCVSDRDKSRDVSDEAPVTGAAATLYPAEFCNSAPVATIRGLTDNWANLRATVNSMSPSGNTNVTIGAAWGLAMLSPGAPFTEAKVSTTPRLRKYMILLTDGDNTENRAGDSPSGIDARTKLACTNVKAAGVQLYTIRVINGNANLLRECATEPGMYKDVKNSSELKPVFEQIAKEISAVRLTM